MKRFSTIPYSRKHHLYLGTYTINHSPAVTTTFEMAADFDNQVIHILDIGLGENRTVTNAAEQVVEVVARDLEIEESDFTWVLYGTDAVVSKFNPTTHGFGPFPVGDTYKPFYERMQELYGEGR